MMQKLQHGEPAVLQDVRLIHEAPTLWCLRLSRIRQKAMSSSMLRGGSKMHTKLGDMPAYLCSNFFLAKTVAFVFVGLQQQFQDAFASVLTVLAGFFPLGPDLIGDLSQHLSTLGKCPLPVGRDPEDSRKCPHTRVNQESGERVMSTAVRKTFKGASQWVLRFRRIKRLEIK